jgi:hypothetical protein
MNVKNKPGMISKDSIKFNIASYNNKKKYFNMNCRKEKLLADKTLMNT